MLQRLLLRIIPLAVTCSIPINARAEPVNLRNHEALGTCFHVFLVLSSK
jgi:hypothetical protein